MDDEPKAMDSAEELDRVVLNAIGERYTVRELRERVSMAEPGVVLMREIPRGTPETMSLMGKRILELGLAEPAYGVVIDLHDTDGTTTPEYRKFLPACINGLHADSHGKLKHIGVAFQGNLVTRTVTNFVVARMLNAPVSVHKARADALEAVRAALLRS
jgi:hypothetical protein